MQLKSVQTKTCGLVQIHHNEDWSGEVVVQWRDEDGYARSTSFPAALILVLHLTYQQVHEGKKRLEALGKNVRVAQNRFREHTRDAH